MAIDSKKIDILNIGLIILSLVIAIAIPFKLFLFAYAILGPLHYLTEINWLEKKNYFVSDKKWMVPAILGAVVITVGIIVKTLPDMVEDITHKGKLVSTLGDPIVQSADEIMLSLFMFSIYLLIGKKLINHFIGLLVCIGLSILICNFIPPVQLMVAVFLPTIVHVFVFTMLFMLYGAIKSKSVPGYASVLLLLAVPLIISSKTIDPGAYQLTQDTWNTFQASTFHHVNATIAYVLGHEGEYNIQTVLGLKIQIFIAFAYTYHYLNWFSKTSIIQWNKQLTKKGMIIVVSIWLASIVLYWYDYKLGFLALLLLSFVHVFLEFPLNYVSIREVVMAPFRKA